MGTGDCGGFLQRCSYLRQLPDSLLSQELNGAAFDHLPDLIELPELILGDIAYTGTPAGEVDSQVLIFQEPECIAERGT